VYSLVWSVIDFALYWLQLEEDPNVCEAVLIHCMSFFPGWGEKNFQVGTGSFTHAGSALCCCTAEVISIHDHVWEFVMQVFGKMIQLIATLVQNCININKRDAFVAITGLVCNAADLLMCKRLEDTELRCAALSQPERRCQRCCCHLQVDKVSDVKLKAPAGELLSLLAEAVGPQFVATQLHKKATLHKSPKVVAKPIMVMVSALRTKLHVCCAAR
jgi:hypothetical protein